MTSFRHPALLTCLIIIGAVLFSHFALSANPFDIKFPIAELGNCGSMAECKAFCDVAANAEACQSYAESHGLAPRRTDNQSKIEEAIKNGGPGGCTSKSACGAYCSDAGHRDECLAFAKAHNLIGQDEIQKIEKFKSKLDAQRIGPGGCRGETACRAYCNDPAHADACLSFAEQNGLMDASEIQRAKKFIELIKTGETPGGCKSKEECMPYCQDPAHQDECIQFAKKAGLITDEEEKNFRSEDMKGPGGCDSPESCHQFCSQPENKATCANFSKEQHNMMHESPMGRGGSSKFQLPSDVMACLKDSLSPDELGEVETGQVMKDSELGHKVGDCFQKVSAEKNKNMYGGSESSHGMMPQKIDFNPLACISKLFGADAVNQYAKGAFQPTADMKGKIIACVQATGLVPLTSPAEQLNTSSGGSSAQSQDEMDHGENFPASNFDNN
ncbi:MAG: hypothetical protein HY220_04310 [Candidatus Sungbacteria bacterium]|uniref:Uncharacterized protein n=1 Tax=Candidatus Sungiibacteriota bacterium TaxID=2750080 RepID=A0A9D6LQU9_9BACT|nr:hypothetical protein [Candidatus Sungbacteria bacterium]